MDTGIGRLFCDKERLFSAVFKKKEEKKRPIPFLIIIFIIIGLAFVNVSYNNHGVCGCLVRGVRIGVIAVKQILSS